LAGARNRFVHDPWGADGAKRKSNAYQLRLGVKDPYYEVVRAAQIIALIRKIERRDTAISRFYRAVLPKLPALHERLGKQQFLDLEFAKKDTHPKKTKTAPRRPSRSS
jgi:hypothetical protein